MGKMISLIRVDPARNMDRWYVIGGAGHAFRSVCRDLWLGTQGDGAVSLAHHPGGEPGGSRRVGGADYQEKNYAGLLDGGELEYCLAVSVRSWEQD